MIKSKHKLSERGELLAMRLKTKIDQIKSSVPRPASGVPLNALPGWADVPLYEKLSMLDCPQNQIVFAKNKIGYGLPRLSSEYDTNCKNEKNEYNPLNDPHLRRFYSRPRNLKLLKQHGMITDDNYVVCNLREFNAYRKFLNRSHLFSIHKELKRIEENRKSTKKSYVKETIKPDYRDPSQVIDNKRKLLEARTKRFQLNLQNIEEKFDKIQKLRDSKSIVLQEKAQLRQVVIERHKIIANDILENNIAVTKAHLDVANLLSEKQLKHYRANLLSQKFEKKSSLWNKRIENKQKTQERNAQLTIEHETKKNKNIQKRMLRARRQWKKLDQKIAEKSCSTNRNTNRMPYAERQMRNKRKSGSLKKSFRLSRMNCNGIEDALYAAMHIEDENSCYIPSNDSVYKAGKYIVEQVLVNITYDLNNKQNYYDLVRKSIDEILEKLQKDILKNAKIAIKNLRNISQRAKVQRSSARSRSVSFYNFVPVIGMSALQDELMFCETLNIINIKSIKDRAPTPAASLTSIRAAFEPTNNEPSPDQILDESDGSWEVQRNEKIFIGYFIIKFKRKLLVGTSKKVFEAIQDFFQCNIYDFNRNFLAIEKSYMTSVMAKAILGYRVNPHNYFGNLRLCISALSASILMQLQNDIQNPRDDSDLDIERQEPEANGVSFLEHDTLLDSDIL